MLENIQMNTTSLQSKKKRLRINSRTKSLLIIIGILIVLGTGGYLYKRNHDLQAENKLLSNPTELAKQQQVELEKLVGALVDLPSGETPTVATVSDSAKLKEQAFFELAQNGDKVLIYSKAKKAYLYRPSTNKMVNIAPVNIGDTTTAQ
jgi:cell division protein FtsB